MKLSMLTFFAAVYATTAPAFTLTQLLGRGPTEAPPQGLIFTQHGQVLDFKQIDVRSRRVARQGILVTNPNQGYVARLSSVTLAQTEGPFRIEQRENAVARYECNSSGACFPEDPMPASANGPEFGNDLLDPVPSCSKDRELGPGDSCHIRVLADRAAPGQYKAVVVVKALFYGAARSKHVLSSEKVLHVEFGEYDSGQQPGNPGQPGQPGQPGNPQPGQNACGQLIGNAAAHIAPGICQTSAGSFLVTLLLQATNNQCFAIMRQEDGGHPGYPSVLQVMPGGTAGIAQPFQVQLRGPGQPAPVLLLQGQLRVSPIGRFELSSDQGVCRNR